MVDQLDILKRGVEEWNTWRKGHPLQRIDTWRGLFGANLPDANLVEANLSGAYLVEANLTGADLSKATLSSTNLTWAQLSGANITKANLTGATLRNANLRNANFVGVRLIGADLTNVWMHETMFIDTDMTRAKGLESCIHSGPSTLDHRTLAKSGQLPLSFLRGVGLPDLLIDLVPALRGDPLQFYKCFISYSTKDQAFADRLHADLQAKGVRCWFAPEDVKAGEKLHEQIDDAIRVFDKLLLVLSEASIASPWVEREIRRARRREVREGRRMLFPLRLVSYSALRDWECFDADTAKDLATEIREYFIPDFSTWDRDHTAYQKALERLLRDLRTEGAAPSV
jgi:TIR domain/Pentapeptide repeats (8 copies)